jgi:hypothetical protein
MATFKELREKTLTPAEKKKKEEIAKAIEKDQPDMPMAKKMAIATATAKKVAEGLEEALKTTHVVIDTADGNKIVSSATNEKQAKSSIVSAERPPLNIKDKKTLKVVQLKKPVSLNKDILGTVLKESVEESVELEEGKMKEFHAMVKKGMTAAQIAKKIGMKEKDVAEFMKGMDESVDLDEGAEVYTMKKGAYTRKVDGKEADKMKKQGWKLMAREGVDFFDLRNLLGEARKDSSADLYFDTYSAAVQHAAKQAEKKGFEVVEDDWFNQVTTGKGKPGRGKTTRHTLKLTKGGKPVRQSLSIQVYNRDTGKKPYELNSYVS